MKSTILIISVFLLCMVNSANAAVFNVSTPAQFQTALNTAAANGQNDLILLAGDPIYNITTTLTYAPVAGNNSLTIQGAGIGNTVLDGGDTLQILNINTSGIAGGDGNAHIIIEGVTFQNGNSAGNGGALLVSTNSANITIEDCEFASSAAANNGAGVFISTGSGVSTFSRNIFTDNDGGTPASNGGGVYASSANGITFTGNTFTNNNAGSDGSGAYASTGGPISFTGNTFTNNDGGTPASNGGGAYASSANGITFTGNTFTNNNAGSDGSGAYASTGGPVTLINNVFGNNSGGTAASDGGGVYISSADNVSLINNTVTGNSAGNFGGGVYISTGGSAINIYNNILWGNTANAGGNDGDDLYLNNSPDTSVNLFNNDIGVNANLVTAQSEDLFVLNTGNYTHGSNIQTDPLLTLNFHLQAGSPCINNGTNSVPPPGLPLTDFEGEFRIAGGIVDIGADEFGSEPFSIPTMTEWGMIIFMILAGLGAGYYLRRRKRAVS